jgi:DDE superfamily endonuclease
MRHPTRAAQKVPDDAAKQCEQSFLRQAKAIRDDGIPAALRVNSDQTNVQIVPGVNETWNEAGQKQVAVNGKDDKHAFTVMNGISASGVILSMQAIYAEKMAMVLPKRTPENAKAWDKIEKTNAIHFDWLGNNSYWSTMRTMKIYVNDILVPYFTAVKEELGLPEIQLSIWQIDCWSVHRSEEFRVWMATEHPNIQLEYVPDGCTGIWQACDVGIQRVFKHAIRQAARADMIAEALFKLQKDVLENVSAIHLTKSLPVIRNRSVGWLSKAYHAVNDPAFVKKVCMLSLLWSVLIAAWLIFILF